MTGISTMFAFVPAMIVFAFAVHWGSLAGMRSSAERLPVCRLPYLGYSFLIVVFSWVLYALAGSGSSLAIFMPIGASLAFAGDFYNLQFEAARHSVKGESTTEGMIAFSFVQLSYTAAYLARVRLAALVESGYLPVSFALVAAILIGFFVLKIWNPARPEGLMVATMAYGLALAVATAIAVSTAILLGGWWILIALGSALFVASDFAMGVTTVHGRHPAWEFQGPWLAYLIAQGLIQYGYARVLP